MSLFVSVHLPLAPSQSSHPPILPVEDPFHVSGCDAIKTNKGESLSSFRTYAFRENHEERASEDRQGTLAGAPTE